MIVYTAVLIGTAQYGLNMLIMGMVAIDLVGNPIIWKIAYSLIELPLMRVAKILAPIFLCSLLMGVVVFIFGQVTKNYFSFNLNFALSIMVGIMSYLIFIFIFYTAQLKELKYSFADSFLKDKIKKLVH